MCELCDMRDSGKITEEESEKLIQILQSKETGTCAFSNIQMLDLMAITTNPDIQSIEQDGAFLVISYQDQVVSYIPYMLADDETKEWADSGAEVEAEQMLKKVMKRLLETPDGLELLESLE